MSEALNNFLDEVILKDEFEQIKQKNINNMILGCGKRPYRQNIKTGQLEQYSMMCGYFKVCLKCNVIKADEEIELLERGQLQCMTDHGIELHKITTLDDNWQAQQKQFQRDKTKYKAYPQEGYRIVILDSDKYGGEEAWFFEYEKSENDNVFLLKEVLQNIPEGKRISGQLGKKKEEDEDKDGKGQSEEKEEVLDNIKQHAGVLVGSKSAIRLAYNEASKHTEAVSTEKELEKQLAQHWANFTSILVELGGKVLVEFTTYVPVKASDLTYYNEYNQVSDYSLVNKRICEKADTPRSDLNIFLDALLNSSG